MSKVLYNKDVRLADNLSERILLKNERKSRAVMTKFEYTQAIGLRCEFLARNVKPNIVVPPEIRGDYSSIAELELIAHVIPFTIKRPIRIKGKVYYELWNLYDDPNDKNVRCELTIIRMKV